MVPEDELTAIVAHELGHWKHGDVISLGIIAIASALIEGLVYRFASKADLKTMGFDSGVRPLVIVIVLVDLLTTGLIVVETPLTHSLERVFEGRADCFAATRGYPIGPSLIRLNGLSFTPIESSRLYEFFYHDHPELSRRLANIQKCNRAQARRL
jgi:STE24 endopeptidase